MTFSSRLGLLYSPLYLLHDPGPGHPESPKRLQAIWNHLQESGLTQKVTLLEPIPHESTWLTCTQTTHDATYIQRVQEACERGDSHIDSLDVGICRASFRVARLAVEGALTLVDWVVGPSTSLPRALRQAQGERLSRGSGRTGTGSGEVRRGFGLVRPPGHHAQKAQALGFCLFNQIAIAARYAQKQYGFKRILILDWDVHHGNGTQHAFEEDPLVFYVSLHQWPLYPGTGRREERGKGNILNIPLPPESGDQEYLKAFEEEILPAVDLFKPELIFISAGFDAHSHDPLANMKVTEAGYHRMTQLVVEMAKRHAKGRVISLLEGGYHLPSLPKSVAAHLEAML